MTDSQIAQCIEAGLGYQPSDAEIAEWRYGPTGRKMTKSEQLTLLETALKGSNNEWCLKVLALIQRLKPGQLISYGNLAHLTNREFGLNISPRNAAWLRKKIYWTIGHDTEIPVHRVANHGDTNSTLDHPVTQHINRLKRGAEGSLHNPLWLGK